jgi:hypothetical protein
VVSLVSGMAGIGNDHLFLRRCLLDDLCGLIRATKWVSMHQAPRSGGLVKPLPDFLHGGFTDLEFGDMAASFAEMAAEPLTAFFMGSQHNGGGHLTLRLEDHGSHALWLTSPSGILASAAGTGTFIVNISPKDSTGTFCRTLLYRAPGSAGYSEAELRIAHLVFAEVAWLHSRGWLKSRLPVANPVLPSRLIPLHALLLGGLSRKEISARLGITVNTVNSYTKEIYRHFGVHSRPALMLLQSQGKVSSPDP